MRERAICLVCGAVSLAAVASILAVTAQAIDPLPGAVAPAAPAQPAPAALQQTNAAVVPTPATISPFDRPATIAAEIGHREGGGSFRQVPGNGAVLVGCEVTLSQFGPSAVIIKSIKPIFEFPDGSRKEGAIQGDPTRWTVRVEAEKGYAVGKMAGRYGDRIDGFYMVFMRRRGDRLDTADQYPGRWLGARAASALVEVKDENSRAAIGMGGRCGADIDALSLIFE